MPSGDSGGRPADLETSVAGAAFRQAAPSSLTGRVSACGTRIGGRLQAAPPRRGLHRAGASGASHSRRQPWLWAIRESRRCWRHSNLPEVAMFRGDHAAGGLRCCTLKLF
ncbi:hypothetical protein RPC_2381 [Rhodopseudomonas palustris BisB18]|uniref:Uncharacterized protein n=1 Tax=Rhodopseudomonas palustris (strain BisB18) TaxID=316056 RepID=Q215K2_RHOPB